MERFQQSAAGRRPSAWMRGRRKFSIAPSPRNGHHRARCVGDDMKRSRFPRSCPNLCTLANAQHQEVHGIFPDMPENLHVGVADFNKASPSAECFGLRRDQFVESIKR